MARELINFRKVCNIAANFARKNIDADIEEKLPTLVEPRTRFTEGEVPEKGTCAHCRGEASLICRTCYSKYSSTFYCSEDHQHRDWSIHKYDCKPLPKLIRPDEVAQAIANSEQPKPKVKYIVPHVECFKSGDTVEIMHVTSERVLYVRPLSENFDKLNDEIEDAAQKAGKMGDTPELVSIQKSFEIWQCFITRFHFRTTPSSLSTEEFSVVLKSLIYSTRTTVEMICCACS